ncbi:hypothetical protein Aut01nite_72520 [Actinoplanes utahensis]|nr:hypothetical protein Aut01nite_72520 [Actinoplanes utahensis]
MLVADRYRLLEPVGAGGMGRVWLARDEMLHRDVAVKEIIPPDWMTDAEQDRLRERTLREARSAARLNHPNVVRIYDVVHTGGLSWIVMEYVPSRSLHQVLNDQGPYDPAIAARIGLAVLDALDAAHQAGVLHRDIKPHNVLIGTDGRVVLTDFGLATFVDDGSVTAPGLIVGSPQYVSPERAREGASTVESDLWSLGATLYAAVEGRSPYARETAMATLAALATEPPDPPVRAGPLTPVLDGLLRYEPAARLTVPEIERRLHMIVFAGSPEAPFPAGRRERSRRSSGENPEVEVLPVASGGSGVGIPADDAGLRRRRNTTQPGVTRRGPAAASARPSPRSQARPAPASSPPQPRPASPLSPPSPQPEPASPLSPAPQPQPRPVRGGESTERVLSPQPSGPAREGPPSGRAVPGKPPGDPAPQTGPVVPAPRSPSGVAVTGSRRPEAPAEGAAVPPVDHDRNRPDENEPVAGTGSGPAGTERSLEPATSDPAEARPQTGPVPVDPGPARPQIDPAPAESKPRINPATAEPMSRTSPATAEPMPQVKALPAERRPQIVPVVADPAEAGRASAGMRKQAGPLPAEAAEVRPPAGPGTTGPAGVEPPVRPGLDDAAGAESRAGAGDGDRASGKPLPVVVGDPASTEPRCDAEPGGRSEAGRREPVAEVAVAGAGPGGSAAVEPVGAHERAALTGPTSEEITDPIPAEPETTPLSRPPGQALVRVTPGASTRTARRFRPLRVRVAQARLAITALVVLFAAGSVLTGYVAELNEPRPQVFFPSPVAPSALVPSPGSPVPGVPLPTGVPGFSASQGGEPAGPGPAASPGPGQLPPGSSGAGPFSSMPSVAASAPVSSVAASATAERTPFSPALCDSPPPAGLPVTPRKGAARGVNGWMLQAGWSYFTDGSGFHIAVPDGWSYQRTGDTYCFRSPRNTRVMSLDVGRDPAADPLAAIQAEARRLADARSLPGYALSGVAPVPLLHKAADWEYRYRSAAGAARRCGIRWFVIDGRGYALGWSTPEKTWSADLVKIQLIRGTFYTDRTPPDPRLGAAGRR